MTEIPLTVDRNWLKRPKPATCPDGGRLVYSPEAAKFLPIEYASTKGVKESLVPSFASFTKAPSITPDPSAKCVLENLSKVQVPLSIYEHCGKCGKQFYFRSERLPISTDITFSPRLAGLWTYINSAAETDNCFRFVGAPFMKDFNARGGESVTDHIYSCLNVALAIRFVCPSLAKAVDFLKVADTLLIHDQGEPTAGEVSRHLQIQGQGVGKHLAERAGIVALTSSLPPEAPSYILPLFDDFEKPPLNIDSPETLLARLIDGLQGNNQVITQGNDVAGHIKTVNKILQKYLAPVSKRLIAVLLSSKKSAAAWEVQQLISHHLDQFDEIGVTLSRQGYGLDLETK